MNINSNNNRHFYFDEIIPLVGDVNALHFPSFPLFEGEHHRLHALTEKRKHFLEVDDVKTKRSRLIRIDFEIKPIGVTFSVDIILKEKAESSTLLLLLIFGKDIHQIPALKG